MVIPWARVVPWLVLGVSLLATFAWWWTGELERKWMRAQRLTAEAQGLASKLGERLATYEQVMNSAASMMALHPETDPDQWRRYVVQLNIPGTLGGAMGMGVVGLVQAGDLAAHQRRMRAKYPSYGIWPEGAREQYFPLLMLYQVAPSPGGPPIGFDAGSDKVRLETLRHAMETRAAAYSPVVRLQTLPGVPISADTDPAILAYVPIYPSRAQSATPLQSDPLGFVVSGMRFGMLITSILRERNDLHVSLTVQNAGQGLRVYDGGNAQAVAQDSHTLSIARGGQRWFLTVSAPPDFGRMVSPFSATRGLVMGICGSLLLFGVATALSRAYMRSQKGLEGILKDHEARFQQLADAAPFPVWRCDTSLTARALNQKWKEYVGRSPTPKSNDWLLRVHQEDRAIFSQAITQAVKQASAGGLSSRTLEIRLQGADDRYRWHLASVNPWLNAQGKVDGCAKTSLRRTLASRLA